MTDCGLGLFLSHSYQHLDLAAAMERALMDGNGGGYTVFRSSNPDRGIKGRRDWEFRLHAHLRRSAGLVFVNTKASRDSKWCFAEVVMARHLGIPIIDMLCEPDSTPIDLETVQTVRVDMPHFTGDHLSPRLASSLITAVSRAIKSPISSMPADWHIDNCPFPGLRPFEYADRAVFFGRNRDLQRFLRELRSPAELNHRLLVIVGVAGAGKSSFIRAALVPALRDAPRPHTWFVIGPLRPHQIAQMAPQQALWQSLLQAADLPGSARLQRAMCRAIDKSVPLSAAGQDDGTGDLPVAIIIDQLEEVLTDEVPERTTAYLDVLESLANFPDIWIIATIRAEVFLTRNLISSFVNCHGSTVVLPPLSDAHLHHIVERPALMAGYTIAPDLLERLGADMRSAASTPVGTVSNGAELNTALPIIALVLRNTWDAMRHRTSAVETVVVRQIGLNDYHAAGGLRAAVLTRIRAAMNRLAIEDRDEQQIVAILGRFVTLTSLDAIPLGRTRLVRVDREIQILEALAAERLVRSVPVTNEGAAYAITHEALFTAWPPLNKWIENHRSDLWEIAQARLHAYRWDQGADDALLSASKAIDLHRLRDLFDDDLLIRFVKASLCASAAADKEARRREAIEAAEAATVRAQGILETWPNLALEYLIPAARRCLANDADLPQGTQSVLLTALGRDSERWVLAAHNSCVRSIAMVDTDATCFFSTGDDGFVHRWDLSGTIPYRSAGLACDWIVVDIAPTSAGTLCLVTADGRLAHWDPQQQTVRVLTTVSTGPTALAGVKVRSGEKICTALSDGNVLVLDTDSGEQYLFKAHNVPISIIASDVGHARIVTGSITGHVAIWELDAGSGKPRLSAHWMAHNSGLVVIALRSDTVLTAARDGSVATWNRHGEPQGVEFRARQPIISGALSASGRTALIAEFDGRLRAFRASWNGLFQSFTDLRDVVPACMTAMRCGRELLFGCTDGTIRAWTVEGRYMAEPRLLGPDPVNVVCFRDDETLLSAFDTSIHCSNFADDEDQRWRGCPGILWTLAASDDGRLVISGTENGILSWWSGDGNLQHEVRDAHEGAITGLAVSPDRSFILSTSLDGGLRIWSATGVPLCPPIKMDIPLRYLTIGFIDGRLYAWFGGDEPRIYRVDMARHIQSFPLPWPSRAAAFGGRCDGRIATLGQDGRLVILSLDGEVIAEATAHEGFGTCVVGKPGLDLFATAGRDGTVRLFTENAVPLGDQDVHHEGGVWALAISPNGRLIASGGADGFVALHRSGDWRDWLDAGEAALTKRHPVSDTTI